MLRSFLARSEPFLSRLRPVRHLCARLYCNGVAGRRRTVPNPGGGPKHLYVGLDDSNGHALYKLDVADMAGDDSDMETNVSTGGAEEPQPLPPPLFRLFFCSFGAAAQFNALGSKIVVTTGSRPSKGLTLVYDTKTAKQDIRPFVPGGLRGIYRTVVAGDKMYAYCPYRPALYNLRDARAHPRPALYNIRHARADHESDDDHDGMDKSESESGDDDDGTDKSESDDDEPEPELDDSDEEDLNVLRERAEGRWIWKRNPMSIPRGARDTAFYATAGPALHPDGRTIFLSTVNHIWDSKEVRSTFSLDTDRPGGEWTRVGDWNLPFETRAHYDRDLDALVGIKNLKDTRRTHHLSASGDFREDFIPHLCSCDLPATTGGNPTPQPAWRLCKEKLTFMQAPLRPLCRTLVHTGRGRFCLVEVAPPLEGFKAKPCLSYGKNGDLMATPLRPGRLYRVSSDDPLHIGQPSAFWI
ncbi:unnamed protein product [Alopecurus aequalis]